MSKGRLAELDVAALFHSILSAYRRTLRDLVGDAVTSTIAYRTIPIIESIIEKSSPELTNTDNTDDALKKFADLLVVSKLVSEDHLEKDGEKCVLDIGRCVFAEHVHSMLSPKDVTCPWAIIAMSMVQKISKQIVMLSLSEFSPLGTMTPIEFLKNF